MDQAIIIQAVETGILHPKISTVVTQIREKETETVAQEASITNLQRKGVEIIRLQFTYYLTSSNSIKIIKLSRFQILLCEIYFVYDRNICNLLI